MAAAGDVLAQILWGAMEQSLRPTPPEGRSSPTSDDLAEEGPSGRYDFDLAEFPLSRLSKARLALDDRRPLTYHDTITGKDGKPVAREWKAYPGPFGFGGASAQALLYELLQLYAEQGACGSHIQFGTLRSLFLRGNDRNPSKDDYERMRRDLDVLRGYDFHCKNAFWDREKQAYVDLKWRLFGAVFYFKETPFGGDELPFGFIEVSPVFQEVARTRSFFNLGFGDILFRSLKPLEQRLAVYLAKRFVSEKTHRRFVDELMRALPIEAKRPRDVRAILKGAAEGLLEKELPVLREFRLEEARGGRWIAVFERRQPPRQSCLRPRLAEPPPSAEVAEQVRRIVDATGNGEDRLWWTQCVVRLGGGPIDRALGQLGEACRVGTVHNRGALLTKIFKDLARESGIALQDGEEAEP